MCQKFTKEAIYKSFMYVFCSNIAECNNNIDDVDLTRFSTSHVVSVTSSRLDIVTMGWVKINYDRELGWVRSSIWWVGLDCVVKSRPMSISDTEWSKSWSCSKRICLTTFFIFYSTMQSANFLNRVNVV